METISERINYVIQNKSKSKSEFAKKIQVTPAYITKIINKGAIPSERVISAICREYGVNEKWLRGDVKDPVFVESSSFSLDQFMADRGASALEVEILKTYFELPKEFRQKLVEHFRQHFAKPAYPEGDIDPDAEAEDYRQELIRQKKAGDGSSVSDGFSANNYGKMA